MAWMAWISRERTGARELSHLMMAAVVWAFFGIFETAAVQPSTKVIWASWEYIGGVTTPVFYFIFVMVFTGKEKIVNSRFRLLLFLIPLTTIFFAFTNNNYHFLWSGFGPVSEKTNLMAYYHGPWFWIGYMSYSYLLLTVATINLFRMALSQGKIFRAQVIFIFLAGMFPWFSSILYLTAYNPFKDYDLTRVTFILSGMVITIARYNYRLFALVPLAREVLVEAMKEGIIVVDSKNNIQDINPAALRFMELGGRDVIGMNIGNIPAGRKQLLDHILKSDADQVQADIVDVADTVLEILVQPILRKPDSRLILLRDMTAEKKAEEELRATMERYRMIAENTSDVLWMMDLKMNYIYVSPSIFQNRGFTPEEFLKLSAEEIFTPKSLKLVGEILRERIAMLIQGKIDQDTLESFEMEHLCKDGSLRIGEVYARPMIDSNGKIIGIHGVTRDITERKKSAIISDFRLELLQYAGQHTLDELMVHVLDETCRLTDSTIGFFHFVENDEKIVSLQAWSTNTSQNFCDIPGHGRHYNLDMAGAWVDCVRLRRTVIHNDYPNLENKRGLPEGHAHVARELVVPIMRNNIIVAILGVGNKESDYNEKDAEFISRLSDIAWDIADNKRDEEGLKQREKLLEVTAKAISMILKGNNLGSSLLDAFALLGSITETDRVYLFENHFSPETGKPMMSQRFEWCNNSFEPQIDNPELQNLPYHDNFSRWYDTLSSGSLIKGFVKDFPESEREILEPQDIQTILVAPVMIGDHFWGFIAFDECKFERLWTTVEENILSTAADTIGALYVRKRNEEELLAAIEKSKESDKLKSSFLNNMSHEIRTPLNGITGFANLLKEENLSHEEMLQYIGIINGCSDQLLVIVEDVLELSRLESSKIQLNVQPFSLTDLMHEIEVMMSVRARVKQLNLSSDNAVNPGVAEILGDKEKIRQVITGLISNAIKFTASGEIRFGYRQNEHVIEFYVKDTGIGIPQNEKMKIFDRFYQVEQDHRKKQGGTGLGLSIAKELVSVMGGDLRVSSKPGLGSVFSFSIPLKPAKKATTMQKTEKEIFSHLTVLVAEDEHINFKYIEALLTPLVKNLFRAHNGSEVLPLLHKNRPDIIFMDIKMPVMDGYEATRLVREIDNVIPIVAVTAYSQPEDRRQAIESGCTDFLSKPVSRETLLEALARYTIPSIPG